METFDPEARASFTKAKPVAFGMILDESSSENGNKSCFQMLVVFGPYFPTLAKNGANSNFSARAYIQKTAHCWAVFCFLSV
jgi:hypothetical protein